MTWTSTPHHAVGPGGVIWVYDGIDWRRMSKKKLRAR